MLPETPCDMPSLCPAEVSLMFPCPILFAVGVQPWESIRANAWLEW